MIGELLQTKVIGTVGQYLYQEPNGDYKVTKTANQSIITYIIDFLNENLPTYDGKKIQYSWFYPTIRPEQESSLQTPAVSIKFISRIKRSLGRYITDIKGNVAKGYLYDSILEIQCMDTSDLSAQDLSAQIDNLIMEEGTIPKLFHYMGKDSFASEQGFSDTYKLNFPANYRTPSEGQFVYATIYHGSYTAESDIGNAEVVRFKVRQFNTNIGILKSPNRVVTFKFKIAPLTT